MSSPLGPADHRRENRSAQRYQRYKRILDWAVDRSSFGLKEAQSALAEERPGFITRLVNDLERHGFLVRPVEGEPVFRWNPERKTALPHWLDQRLFGSQVKAAPLQERPREKLLAEGVSRLTHSELLAILIRSGRPGESAIDGGRKLARAFENRWGQLADAGRAELKAISPAVEKTAFCQIMAGIELGRRIESAEPSQQPLRLSSSTEAIAFCQRYFQRLASDGKQEEFHIVCLDTKNQFINSHQVTVGTLDASLVHPREVFRPAIRDAASSVILVHNHPSGDPTPSREDFAVTDRLLQAGRLLGIDVLDHIVLGYPTAVSIEEQR